MTQASPYFVQEHPGVIGFALMRRASLTCAVDRQMGCYFLTREAAQAEADRINAFFAQVAA